MKCSLLTLSTFIDREMPVERHAEVDAHLVGCPRCTAGVTTLREEKLRIAQLARVRVPAPSAAALLESIGVSSAPVVQRSAQTRREVAPAPETRPWLEARSSAALPWTPTRPAPPRPAGIPSVLQEDVSLTEIPAEVQPDLPFDRIPVAEPSAAAPTAAAAASVELEPEIAGGPSWADEEVAPDAWELQVPGYAGHGGWDHAVAETVSAPETIAREVAAPPSPSPAPLPPPVVAELPAPSEPAMAPMSDVTSSAPPRRAEGPVGARGVWTRARDAIALRLALAGSDRGIEESAEIVTGPTQPRRNLPPPIAGFESPAVARPHPAAATTEGLAVAGPVLEQVPARPVPSHPAPAPRVDRRAEAPVDRDRSFDWNAFGGSGYPEPASAPVDEGVGGASDRKAIGRHSRALQRGPSSAAARATALFGSALSVVRQRGSALQRHGSRLSPSARGVRAPSLPLAGGRRALLAAGLLAAIVLVAVLATRGSTPHPGATAVHQTTAPVRASSAPTTAASAAPTAVAAPSTPALANPLSFGSGGTGFQVVRLRYGSSGGAQRVVFDLTGASGSPSVTVGATDATTVLVTFAGAVQSGGVTPAPAGGLIKSISMVSSGSGKTVYQLMLARPARPSAFYLTGPLRFVLDIR